MTCTAGDKVLANSFSLSSADYKLMDYDHRKIREIVEQAMNENEEFKDHRNREKLWLFLKSKYPGMRISAESVNRAQRKLWEQNRCLPTNPNKLIEWYSMRIKGFEEYLQYYGGKKCQQQ